MFDWFRNHFLRPVHDLETRLVHKVEDLGGFIVRGAYHGGQRVLHGFEAAGSSVMHRVTGTAHQAVINLDKGIHKELNRGLAVVEGAASTVLHKVENAGTSVIHNLEHATVATVRGVNNHIIHPVVHALEQPIENAWHGVENVAVKTWHGAEHAVSAYAHWWSNLMRPVMYLGVLVGGVVVYKLVENERSEQALKRRRYR